MVACKIFMILLALRCFPLNALQHPNSQDTVHFFSYVQKSRVFSRLKALRRASRMDQGTTFVTTKTFTHATEEILEQLWENAIFKKNFIPIELFTEVTRAKLHCFSSAKRLLVKTSTTFSIFLGENMKFFFACLVTAFPLFLQAANVESQDTTSPPSCAKKLYSGGLWVGAQYSTYSGMDWALALGWYKKGLLFGRERKLSDRQVRSY